MFSLPIHAAIGDNLTLSDGSPVTISAETFAYYSDIVVAEGAVEITYRASRLTADRVEFNQMTGDALAIGNVMYEEGGETLQAEQAEFNLNDNKGLITKGDLSLADDQYFTGKEIRKTGENSYLIKHGTFTACKSQHPAWQFSSSTTKINQGEYLQSWNTVGYIQGIPIIYLPFFVYPIKTERQTGLLVPAIGYSKINGFTVGNSFFWAISRSQDATLYYTFYENRGHKFDIEYRYTYSKDTDGNFEAQYVRDTLEQKQRKELQWSHRQGLPFSITSLINLKLTSDDKFDKDFSTQYEDRTSQTRRSNISFTRNFSQHTIRLLVERLDDLRPESKEYKQRLPELQFTSQKQQLFKLPLYVQQTSQISRLQYNKKNEGKDDDQLDFTRIDFQPTISLPLTFLGQALTIEPAFQFRETYYTRDATSAADPDLDAASTHREYYTVNVNVTGPRVYRIFDFGTTKRLQKIKHLIEPYMSFQYRPGIDEDDLPRFDGVDRIGSTDRSQTISYGITQRLLTKRVTTTDWERFLNEEDNVLAKELATETNELASLSLSQSYNFENHEDPFSNINITLKTTPIDQYNLTLNTSYDVYVNTFSSTDVNLTGNLGSIGNFGLQWRRSADVNHTTKEIKNIRQSLNANTRVTLFNKLELAYSGRFNIKDHQRIEDVFEVKYTAQCWNVSGSYTLQLVDVDKGTRDDKFQIIVELKHLGKLFEYNK